MKLFFKGRNGVILKRCLALILSLAMASPVLTVGTASAAPGDITDNSGIIPFDQAFFAFEVESPLGSLKEVPIWDELEKMLDNPYQVARDLSLGLNTQGFPSYRSTQLRRRSFVYRNAAGNPCAPGTAGCTEITLSRHVVHPLNYNHMTGEEMRLVNMGFEGAPWMVPDVIVLMEASNTDASKGPLGVARYEQTYVPVGVSPGEGRIEGDEAAIDFNSPIGPNVDPTDPVTYVCIVTPEVGITDSNNNTVPEGSIICGGDPGEPGYAGFGLLLPVTQQGEQYSLPALPLNGLAANLRVPGRDITAGPGSLGTGSRRLFDPARGFINPRSATTGVGGLRKPSLRIPEAGGTPANPNYAVNSVAALAADPAALMPSNENDYVRNRNVAMALGKALFWDMQVGSDGVQSCGSCHFHAGVDNRTKNQLNPNHLGGDLTLHVGIAAPLPDGSQPANQTVTANDFPFHKLVDVDFPAEETNCGLPGLPACTNANLTSDTNDVMSSMGVVFSPFTNIQPIGQFIANPLGVRVTPPDIRTAGAVDPIPVFQGLRRVEPRNTPTIFGATLNFDNFWDGRARHDFNGGSVFGPSDPQHHVFVGPVTGSLEATRQIIRFASLASLSTGPGLSEFEMSFLGRNWSKIAKKLLQGTTTANRTVPLANQLVSTTDSVLGPWSNQGGSACAALLVADRSTATAPAAGKPGLCISYPALIRQAFYPALWQNTSQHLNGCYTDDLNPDTPQNTPVCTSPPAIPVLADGAVNEANAHDPFDGYVLTIAAGAASATNRDQFSQMEANFPLFWGLSIHLWGTILMPDDAPMDRFFDRNPDSHVSFGEANEVGLVLDLRNCFGQNGTGGVQPCFTEVGNFKRDPNVIAYVNNIAEGVRGDPVPSGGTRQAGAVDPLLGMDFFLGSNLSLKNPAFRSLRCGECHAGGTLTDHTVEISHQFSFNDFVQEFVTPGVGLFPEPLGRGRVISGFSLESEANGNAQDAIERNVADFCAVEPCEDGYGNAIPGGLEGGFPQGSAFFDNGVYNIGTRPIAEDVGRGGLDGFGWPLSLSRLMLKNIGGVGYSSGGDDPLTGFAQPPDGGIPLPNFDPAIDPVGGGVFEFTVQDQQINPGFEEDPEDPQLPAYLAPWASNNVVGDEVEQDEVFAGLNTRAFEPILEGYVDTFGPFNVAATIGEVYNNAQREAMSTWPNVNRVNGQGSFKAPSLRNVELSGPYFHTGHKLTLRQEFDFYDRGGDFPKMNAAHRDFLIMNLDAEDEALGGCVDPADPLTTLPCSTEGVVPMFTDDQKETIKVSVIDFLLELTDERVAFERAPFDHPEIFVPLDGRAPDNSFGRPGFLTRITGNCNGIAGAGPCFRQVPAVGQGGRAARLPNFLGVSRTRVAGANNDHYDH